MASSWSIQAFQSRGAIPVFQQTHPACTPKVSAHFSSKSKWLLISVSASDIEVGTDFWHRENSKRSLHIVGRYNETIYEVLINRAFLPSFEAQGLLLDGEYNPIFGVTQEACNAWLRWAAFNIRSDLHAAVAPTYNIVAQSNGLHEALARAILNYDITVAIPPNRTHLAQNLVILFMIQEADHTSSNTDFYLSHNEENLLRRLQDSLQIPITPHPQRPRADEAHLTVLITALLKMSGVQNNTGPYRCARKYAVQKNASLCASFLGVARTRVFEDIDLEETCTVLSRSPVFIGYDITVEHLGRCIRTINEYLPIGFPRNHLNLPPQVPSKFTADEMAHFAIFLGHAYTLFPSLRKPENNSALLVVWSSELSSSTEHYSPLAVLCEWATSEEGRQLYERMVDSLQEATNMEQLALTIAYLITYRRLHRDIHDSDVNQPIRGSYLNDLDTFLHGHGPGNSGKVAEQMAFASIRVHRHVTEKLTVFLGTILDREPPLLHCLDGFTDHYLSLRIKGQSHKAAFESVKEQAAQLGISELGRNDDRDREWTMVNRGKP